jgi:hypothetical protein
MSIATFEGQTLENKSFVVEESSFISCVLKNCHLYYSGGDFDWVSSQFMNCHWHFRGPALKTVQLEQTLGMLQFPAQPVPSSASKTQLN